jgi:hypothetical protein
VRAFIDEAKNASIVNGNGGIHAAQRRIAGSSTAICQVEFHLCDRKAPRKNTILILRSPQDSQMKACAHVRY